MSDNHLLRSHAPISGAGWEEIDQEAREHLLVALAARRLVDFSGPHGWEYSATNLGRTEPLAEARQGMRRVYFEAAAPGGGGWHEAPVWHREALLAGNEITGPAVIEEWERRVSFVGQSPAEAFAMAADWLERRPEIETLGDVGWHHTASGHQLRIYYRA